METVAIVDTSLCTDNLGDEIIMDAVNDIVWDLFPSSYIVRVPSHEALSDRTRKMIAESDWCFIGGTNLLSSSITRNGLWRLESHDAKYYGLIDTVCLGTGWNDYMPSPTPETQAILRTALTPRLVHSVRDSYTREHLNALGIAAITTSCPTTWSLTPELCKLIPRARASAAIFTLSAWRPDPVADSGFVDVLRRCYSKLYFFPQMRKDLHYLDAFGRTDVSIVNPTVEAYTRFLANEDVDFVGTRLHGGIRALQKGRRALILAVDNRAAEISKDTGLPVLPRTDLAGIEEWIEGGAETRLDLPQQAIEDWRAQFRPSERADVVKRRPDRDRLLRSLNSHASFTARGFRAAKRIVRKRFMRVGS